MNSPDLTVIVPVFNEERTVADLLARLAAGVPDAQVVVDDGSTDRTPEPAPALGGPGRADVLRQPANRGKGAAVRRGLEHAAGEVTVIQDADLEYDPAELPAVVGPVLRGEAQAVYGSRLLTAAPARGTPRTGWPCPC